MEEWYGRWNGTYVEQLYIKIPIKNETKNKSMYVCEKKLNLRCMNYVRTYVHTTPE